MASFTVSTGKVGAYNKTLTASTVDTVSFADDVQRVEVGSKDGTAEIWFTVDGSAPTVAGQNCFYVPAVAGAVREVQSGARLGADAVKLISSGTPTYWVAVAS